MKPGKLVVDHKLRYLFNENPVETQQILDLHEDLKKFSEKHGQWFYLEAYRLWQMGWRKTKQ